MAEVNSMYRAQSRSDGLMAGETWNQPSASRCWSDLALPLDRILTANVLLDRLSHHQSLRSASY